MASGFRQSPCATEGMPERWDAIKVWFKVSVGAALAAIIADKAAPTAKTIALYTRNLTFNRSRNEEKGCIFALADDSC